MTNLDRLFIVRIVNRVRSTCNALAALSRPSMTIVDLYLEWMPHRGNSLGRSLTIHWPFDLRVHTENAQCSHINSARVENKSAVVSNRRRINLSTDVSVSRCQLYAYLLASVNMWFEQINDLPIGFYLISFIPFQLYCKAEFREQQISHWTIDVFFSFALG